MANWVHELELFIFAVLAHWQALATGGLVTASVNAIEKKRNKSLSWKSYALFMSAFLLYSVFAAWQDEHRNTQAVEAEKAEQTGLANSCRADSRVEHALYVGSQGLIDSQRDTIDKQQLSHDAQQRDVSSCVVSLGKMNPIVRERIDVVVIPFAHTAINGRLANARDLITVSLFEVFIITNEPQRNFHGRLRCDKPFNLVDSPAIRTSVGMVMVNRSKPLRISDSEYEIRVDASATEWNPSHPAYMEVSSYAEHLGNCAFTPVE